MVKLRTILLSLFVSIIQLAVGQYHQLYQLEESLKAGDKSALFQIAKYFSSKKKMYEYIDSQRYKTTENIIAKRIIAENCLFTNEEIVITNSTTTKQFIEFLIKNKDKIFFSKLTNSFLITPLEQRSVNFQVRELSETRKQKLAENTKQILEVDCIKDSAIDTFIKNKDSYSLLLIASEFYKFKPGYDNCFYEAQQLTDALQLLTGLELGVENEKKEITWLIDNYFTIPKLNVLIFYDRNYSQYKWDDKKACFINPSLEIKKLTKEEKLFQLLKNKNDSIAFNAFIQLTTCDSLNVTKLADEYEDAEINSNYSIPTFPYKFLKQLVTLTKYCKTNNIDFIGTSDLQNRIMKLIPDMNFVERRKLEDELIKTLTLENITALEYWSLINEKSYNLQYSVGRILDIFYSQNWNKLINNEKQLKCYLKKSALLSKIGINGLCNNYLVKFNYSTNPIQLKIKSLHSNDDDINSQIKNIITVQFAAKKSKKIDISIWEGNKNYKKPDIKKKIIKLTQNIVDSTDTDYEISGILSQIDYSQIPLAIELIENYHFQSSWQKYSFILNDFGLFMVDNLDEKESRAEFLKLYSKFTEYELYSYYLDKTEIDYKTADNTLDYEKIYDEIKYNEPESFVGTTMCNRNNEVYSIIKLLELTFKTNLGFPNKLCNSNNSFECNARQRVFAWLQFLEKRNLLKREHTEPISFNYE